MELSPEERKRIYEEEKAKIEAPDKEGHQEEKKTTGGSTLGLKPNVAGLLCYVGFWVTGIIFLIIERKNRLLRFHAMQSLVTFGILMIIWNSANYARGFAWAFEFGRFGLSYLQWVAGSVVFAVAFTLWWVLWGILLYKTYHGTPYRVPFFSGIADRCLAKLDGIK